MKYLLPPRVGLRGNIVIGCVSQTTMTAVWLLLLLLVHSSQSKVYGPGKQSLCLRFISFTWILKLKYFIHIQGKQKSVL